MAEDGTAAGDAMAGGAVAECAAVCGAAAGEGVAEDAATEVGAAEGAVVIPEEEQMVWAVLDRDWRAVQGDVLVGGLEEMGRARGG